MEKKKTPIGHRFKKGQSGNPGGRPKLPENIRNFKETSYREFLESLQKYGSMTRDEITANLKRPEATMFEVMFGTIVDSAARGDKDARTVLLDRLWGKVTEKHELKEFREKLSDIPDDKLIQLVKET